MSFNKEIISRSAEETFLAGMRYAVSLKKRSVVGLFGNLGSGKTQFVKGICNHFNVKDVVNSPTFIIVNEYRGFESNDNAAVKINHFDLYRLKDLSELIEIGLGDYINDCSICLIEWAELADNYLKGKMERITFEHGSDENERIIKF